MKNKPNINRNLKPDDKDVTSGWFSLRDIPSFLRDIPNFNRIILNPVNLIFLLSSFAAIRGVAGAPAAISESTGSPLLESEESSTPEHRRGIVPQDPNQFCNKILFDAYCGSSNTNPIFTQDPGPCLPEKTPYRLAEQPNAIHLKAGNKNLNANCVSLAKRTGMQCEVDLSDDLAQDPDFCFNGMLMPTGSNTMTRITHADARSPNGEPNGLMLTNVYSRKKNAFERMMYKKSSSKEVGVTWQDEETTLATTASARGSSSHDDDWCTIL